MASSGRGRGRGRGAIFLKETKPGGLQQQQSSPDTDELADLIKGLSFDVEEDKIESCVEIAAKQATSAEALERVAKAIYKPCYADWQFSVNAAIMCRKLVHVEADGAKFHQILLKAIQSDYKNKEEIRSVSAKKVAGCCAFISQLFCYLQNPDGSPKFKPLSSFILDYFELLLDNKAEELELECVYKQLLTAGPLIHQYGDAKRLAKLKNVIREKILDTNLSRELRTRLIDVIEAFASQWTLNVIKPTSVS